jgi:hypothetical protein
MPEVHYNKSHHAGATAEQRIANRLRNSGGGSAPSETKETHPQRLHHNIHHGASQHERTDMNNPMAPNNPKHGGKL